MDDFQVPFNDGSIIEDEDVKKMNFFQRIIGVIVSPGETMKSIIAKPSVVIPIIFTAIVPVLIYLMRFSLYMDNANAAAKKVAKRMADFYIEHLNIKMTPEQIANMSKVNPITTFISIAIGALLAWFVGTVILFALIKIFRGKGSFKQVISISIYSYVILLLGTLITVLVSFITGSIKLDLSLGIFSDQILSGQQGTFLFGFMYTVLSSISIFAIWNYIVVGIGTYHLSKLSKTKVVIILSIIFVLYLLFTGISAGFSEATMGLISAKL